MLVFCGHATMGRGDWRKTYSLKESTDYESSPLRVYLSKELFVFHFSPQPHHIWPFKFQRKCSTAGVLRITMAQDLVCFQL